MSRRIGDKVKIRPDLKQGMGTREDNYIVDKMFSYAGVETTVTRISDDGESYCVQCDDGKWYWPDIALMPLSNGERIRNMTDEELAIFLREIVISTGENLFDCNDFVDECSGNCEVCNCYFLWLKRPGEEVL